MRRLMKSEKAQAALEVAIVASIMILAFSSLINFTEKINRKQRHMQNTFRSQLRLAYGNGYAGGSQPEYYRAPNIIDPYAPGELVYLPSSQGEVRWNSQGTGTREDVGRDGPKGKEWEKLEYIKTFTRKESRNGQLDASHEVRYRIFDTDVVRGEYVQQP